VTNCVQVQPNLGTAKTVNIAPVFQQTPEWCWLAVAQMVLSYYNVPSVNQTSYQCGLVAWFYGPTSVCWTNCGACAVPASSINAIDSIYTFFPPFSCQINNVQNIQLTYSNLNTPLDSSTVISEIDGGSPIETGVNPDPGSSNAPSSHVALIVGYEHGTDGSLMLIVNDPWPYDNFPTMPHPYTMGCGVDDMSGTFEIRYVDFKNALRWKEAIYHFRAQ
jgi:hypothetical protein